MEKYTSIHYIMDRLKRHPMLTDLSLETVVDLTIEFMQVVGVPDIYEDNLAVITIKNYRGYLPNNWYQTNQVLYNDIPMRYTTDTFGATDSSIDNVFKIQGGYIYTSFEVGEVTMSYKAFAIDCDGFPKVPESGSFTRALESYIKKHYFTILFDLGKLPKHILDKTEQEYSFNVGSCITDLRKMDLSKAESFYNSLSTRILRHREFDNRFTNDGMKEQIRRH